MKTQRFDVSGCGLKYAITGWILAHSMVANPMLKRAYDRIRHGFWKSRGNFWNFYAIGYVLNQKDLPVAGCGFFRMSSIEYKRNPLTIHRSINAAMDDNTTNVITTWWTRNHRSLLHGLTFFQVCL